MKNLTILIVVLIISSLFSLVNAQTCCTPDTTLVDSLQPGEFHPEDLPEATEGQYYSETITILAPPSVMGFEVDKIRLDSVTNLPAGLSWCKDDSLFVVTDPNTHYCINIEGTPTDTGHYQLELYVTPWIMVSGSSQEQAQMIDDTTISIHVGPDITKIEKNNQLVINDAYPNPFSDNTNISFNAESKGSARLTICNLLGEIIYNEEKNAVPGKNQFNFNGKELSEGTYIYSIKLNGKKQSSKLIKTK